MVTGKKEGVPRYIRSGLEGLFAGTIGYTFNKWIGHYVFDITNIRTGLYT